MIVMVESGRLGNQVFQYLALRSAAEPDERLVLFGFEQLRDIFDGVDATFISIQDNPLRHLMSLDATRIRRISNLVPGGSTIIEGDDARPVRGRPGGLTLVEPSWFQRGEAISESAFDALRVKAHLVDAARQVLDEHGLAPGQPAFVHVRAGDYRTWPTPQAPAILDIAEYQRLIALMRVARPGVPIIAIGDDAAYTAQVTAGVDDVIHIQRGEGTEFALMTLCSAGVLSASSFAFWGAALAHRSAPTGPYLAPRFWAGHANGSWYPAHIESPFVTYC